MTREPWRWTLALTLLLVALSPLSRVIMWLAIALVTLHVAVTILAMHALLEVERDAHQRAELNPDA